MINERSRRGHWVGFVFGWGRLDQVQQQAGGPTLTIEICSSELLQVR